MPYRRNPPKGEPGHQEVDPFTRNVLWVLAIGSLALAIFFGLTR